MSEAPPGARELPLLVAEGGAAKSFYSFAKLSFLNAADGVLQTAAVILITKVQGRYLIAVPKNLWSRQTAQRLLPARTLERPVLCEVAVALADRPGAVLEDETMKLWIGVLAKAQEGRLSELGDGDDVEHAIAFSDVEDHEERIPFGQALADLAEDHFAFHSAGERMSEGSGGDLVEKRMAILEENMGAMQEALTKLVSLQDQSRIGEQPHSGGLPVSGIGPQEGPTKTQGSAGRWRRSAGARPSGGAVSSYGRGGRESVEVPVAFAGQEHKDARPASSKAEIEEGKGCGCAQRIRGRGSWCRGRDCRGCGGAGRQRPRSFQFKPHGEGGASIDTHCRFHGSQTFKGLGGFAGWCRRRFRRTGSYGGRNGKEQGREPVLHLPDCRGSDGCRFSSKPNGSWSYAPGYFEQSLGRAPVKGAEFSKLGESHMEPCRNPRLFENGGRARSTGQSCGCDCGLGSVQFGQRKLADVAGGDAGTGPTLCSFSDEEAAGCGRTVGQQIAGRTLAGSTSMETSGSGQLSRNQEETYSQPPEGRSEGRIASGGEAAQEAAQAAKRRRDTGDPSQ